MLSHLYIRNFTLVDALDLELHPGLTVLTGETGAGKSILLDAIGLTLGDRANADTIRQGCDKADVCAHFNLSQRPELLQWLEEQDLAQNQDCLLRRSLSRDGRSRAFINDRPVTLQQLRQLGERLINLHGQHEHQALMDLAHHRELLDTFGQLHSSAGTVKADYQTWLGLQQDYERLQQQSDELNARYQLLSYQAEEFQQMALKEGELQSLEKQHKHLTHAEQFQHSCNALVELCSGDKGLAERLRRGIGLLQALPVQTPRVQEALGLLSSAQIQIEEANDELLRALDDNRHLDGDLASIEQRLSSLYELARKHKIKPEALLEQQAQLELELAHLKSGDDQLALLATQITAAHARYQQSAADLSQARASAAQLLAEAVNQQLQQLAMGHACLSVVLHPLSQPSPQGAEQVELYISTIPGQAPKPLVKIASGGELSRVSLAIAVVTAQNARPGTLIFDEVDVGIGGETGDVVGRLLRQLGAAGQVLCVTHLAQVASKAHQHLKISKTLSSDGAQSQITQLTGQATVQEIARMMGGVIDSAQSLAHAQEMLERA